MSEEEAKELLEGLNQDELLKLKEFGEALLLGDDAKVNAMMRDVQMQKSIPKNENVDTFC